MAYGHAERNLAALRQLEVETRQLLESLDWLDPEQSAWLQGSPAEEMTDETSVAGRDRGRFYQIMRTRCGLCRPGDDVAAGQSRDAYASKYSSNSCGCGRSRIGSISPERL
jgi:hypothetical protein